MSASDILAALLAANIAISAGILVVLLLRVPVSRVAGARAAYALWLVPLLAGAALLLPAPSAEVIPVASAPIQSAAEALIGAADFWMGPSPALPAPDIEPLAPPLDIAAIALAVWIAGALGFFALTLVRQRRSLKSFGSMTQGARGLSASANAGPAVIGVIRPRLVLPSDFETRFDERERELILAHERIHLVRGDTRINAALALLACINWFNPLVHLAVRLARKDQELACDAAVVERFPGERRIYAEALLKTQLAPASLPLGCTWPPRSSSLLKERVMMLARKSPGRTARIAGVVFASVVALGGGLFAWAQKPVGQYQTQSDADKREIRRQAIERLLPKRSPTSGDVEIMPTSATLQQQLRIVALRRALIEVRSATGDKYVRRYFEPGESYSVRVGYGWTVTAPEDGSAFEWRLGDQSLGLLQTEGGPAYAFSVDLAAKRQPGSALAEDQDRPLEPTGAGNGQPDDTEPEPQRPIETPQPLRSQRSATPQNEPVEKPEPANMIVTCNSWNGRHSLDPKVDWDNVKKDAPVVFVFSQHDTEVTFPQGAFPQDVYANAANAKQGLRLKTGARYVYQSMSSSVIDTITLEGLDGNDIRAVWQRFRIDEKEALPIALQGSCARS